MSVNNNNLIYWKSTKNFQDGCSAHIYGAHGISVCLNLDMLLVFTDLLDLNAGGYFDGNGGQMAMPGG